MKLVNPANKRKYDVIVVGSGLAGASAAATLAELGYNVNCFCYQDSPRRAHSIAAQGGINAAKNYQNDGDSVFRLFYDTVKGGDFRAREANVYRLAEVSVNIIDQCVAQGVPFAREYGGLLANRSLRRRPGLAHLLRPGPDRPAAPARAPTQALERQIGLGKVKMYTRHEMLELVVVDGRARGIVTRDMVTGKIESHLADAVVLGTGGYGNVFYLATYAKGCNTTAIWRAYKKGAAFANPCYTQIHPTCIPVTGDHQSKLTLMSESLRNDGRIWVPKKKGDNRAPRPDPRGRARLLPRAQVPELRQPRAPRHRLARRQAGLRRRPRRGRDRPRRLPRLRRRHQRAWARTRSREKYGNLFDMYERITDENPYKTPMRIYPAIHYTMGGLWVDYNLMSTIPGLHVLGEANFSDHGANRLGASALMQGLADGYFVMPYTIGHYLATQQAREGGRRPPRGEGGRGQRSNARTKQLLGIKGKRTVDVVPPRARARSCGSTAAWPATARAWRRRSRRSPPCARSSGRTSTCWARTKSSTSRSRRPAAWPTSWSSASSCAWTPSSARSPAAATSARSTRPRTARHARRRQVLPRRGLGVHRRRQGPQRNVEPLAFENVHLQQRSYK